VAGLDGIILAPLHLGLYFPLMRSLVQARLVVAGMPVGDDAGVGRYLSVGEAFQRGRVIVLDDKLTTLLSPPANEQITYLNIQKYLSPHYLKTEPVPEPVPEPQAAPAPTPVKRPVVKKKPVA
jgi:hypothetical protein